MTDINLEWLEDQGFVVHFGGRPGDMNAATLGNALLAISDSLKAINQTINPGHHLEVKIDATGNGSFRALLRITGKSLGSLFSAVTAKEIVVGIFVSYLYSLLVPQEPAKIVVNTKEVILEVDGKTILVPREVYEATQQAAKNPAVPRAVSKVVSAVRADPAVTDFGITGSLGDKKPLVSFGPKELAILQERLLEPTPSDQNERYEDQEVDLVIRKAVFVRFAHLHGTDTCRSRGLPALFSAARFSRIESLSSRDVRGWRKSCPTGASHRNASTPFVPFLTKKIREVGSPYRVT